MGSSELRGTAVLPDPKTPAVVDLCMLAPEDEGGGVHLLDDGRTSEPVAGEEPLSPEDGHPGRLRHVDESAGDDSLRGRLRGPDPDPRGVGPRGTAQSRPTGG